MNLVQMLEELRAERQRLEEAILVIERLAAGGARRRGRPPKWMSKATATDTTETQPKKRSVSAAARKRMAAAQKKRWAAKRAQSRSGVESRSVQNPCQTQKTASIQDLFLVDEESSSATFAALITANFAPGVGAIPASNPQG